MYSPFAPSPPLRCMPLFPWLETRYLESVGGAWTAVKVAAGRNSILRRMSGTAFDDVKDFEPKKRTKTFKKQYELFIKRISGVVSRKNGLPMAAHARNSAASLHRSSPRTVEISLLMVSNLRPCRHFREASSRSS